MFTRLRALAHHLNARMASTVSGTHVVNSNTACCTIPPVPSDYKPKGSHIAYAGFKDVYITGPETSDMAIVVVYDIFGFKPQTQLGADMLAKAMNARVLMPDFFEPNEPFPLDRFPPKSKDDEDALQKFFAGPAKPEKAVDNLVRVGKTLRDDGAKWVGAYGLCWGGKVTILAGSEPAPVFSAVSAIHPAMLKAEDADKLAVPLGLFISKDEPKDEYDKVVEKIKDKPYSDKNMYKYYPTMFHGWAAARADLKDPENKKQFEDVYAKLDEFFSTAFERNRGGTQTRL